jgi:thiamine pyrophosphate-dependent acetolactate synthase large subunit-like protein
MQTVDRTVEVLEEAGIDHVFGIPGGDTGRIYKALYDKQDKIKVILARDEQTAACMAEMYGRLTGWPGVFMAQGCYAALTNSPRNTVTAWPPSAIRVPCTWTRTTPPRADAW